MAIVQVAHNRLTNVDGDREKFVAVALSPDREFPTPPVDVIDPQPGYLATA